MSFSGLKFKKTNVEGVADVLEKLNLSEQLMGLIRSPDSVSSFTKNADGTISYVVEAGGKNILNETITLGKETDFTAPDGHKAKVVFNLSGNELKSTMTFGDGKKIHLNRAFEGNTFTLTVHADGSDQKGVVHYAAV